MTATTNITPPPLRAIHHMAFRCRDAEETRAFYENVLGLEYAGAFRLSHDPESAEPHEYVHIFFKMAGGDFVAFFDDPRTASPDGFAMKSPYDSHMALSVGSMEELAAFKARFEAFDMMVVGPIDHEFCQSIYVYDPNGLPVEITVKVPEHDAILAKAVADSPDVLARWAQEKKALVTPDPA